ncbi:uncharacterized protein [Dysidea avara]|uniref:uncharacterized protein n=1 Tax=Dysidea avara TaxID=196820 RepID=UPI0033260DB2
MGLKAASAEYSCLWCTVHKDDRYNMTLTHCPRSLSDLKGNGDFSNIHKPLLNLDLDHIIPDELHLMLRVTDRLITALIQTAKSYDQHQHRLERIRRAYKVLDGERIKNLIAAIRECGVYFNIYEDDESGKVEWPSLLGPDKLKLLKNLPDKLVGCQPPEMVPLTQNLWKDFDLIYSIVTSRVPTRHHQLRESTKKWINDYLDLGKEFKYGDFYYPDKVTPYMHLLCAHLSDFIDKYDNVKQFSCQGVEKRTMWQKYYTIEKVTGGTILQTYYVMTIHYTSSGTVKSQAIHIENERLSGGTEVGYKIQGKRD